MGRFVAAILVIVTIGSVVFHFLSPWWWTEIASNWGYIDTAILITFWITGFVFVAVLLFRTYCVLKFRHQKGRKAAYEPENKKLEWWLTGITTVGIVAMLTPGLFVWGDFINVAGRRYRDRSRRQAMGLGLPSTRRGRRPRQIRSAVHRFR